MLLERHILFIKYLYSYFTSSNINTTVYQYITDTRERYENLIRAVKANKNREQ